MVLEVNPQLDYTFKKFKLLEIDSDNINFLQFNKEWQESMATNILISTSILELRELHRWIPKTAQAKVMVTDKVFNVWKWLKMEYCGCMELTTALIGRLQAFQLNNTSC